MSRKEGDSPVSHSSIALLQERFRQLQRAKEIREERELLRQRTEFQRIGSTTCNDPSRLFFHSELIVPPRQPLQSSSTSLHHNLQRRQSDLQSFENPTSANSQYRETVMYRPSNFEDSDIDTSLHL